MNIGELFIVGYDGLFPPEPLLSAAERGDIGGVILFSRNFSDLDQLMTTTEALRSRAFPRRFLIAVDHEGGRVQRFGAPFTKIPPFSKFGSRGDLHLAERVAQLAARELSAAGITLNLSPVADVLTNPENSVIGDRSASGNPETTASFVKSMVRGLQSGGIAACAKHFPGHGHTLADSHEEVPIDPRPIEQVQDCDFVPFYTAIEAGVAAIMTAHLINPSVDPLHPATLSHTFLTQLLRNYLRFDGAIITDDLEMKAISLQWSVAEAALLALQAGADLLLVCHHWEEAISAKERVEREAAGGKLSHRRVDSALQHAVALKNRFPGKPLPLDRGIAKRIIGCPEHQKWANV
ncbi:MAG: beta-N-acetylhexosaminidase [Deltaproteobacteria bacterium]|nr:beta-N-acetylhexosaminidase [Deltaproteobacteria bacterium]